MNRENEKNPQSCSLKVSEIKDNVLRLDFYSQSYLEELKHSISQEGLLEPLLVHKNENTKGYTLLNGHYRIRALRQLRILHVACNVIVCDEEQAISNYIASFIRKNGLSALEEGHILSNLVRKGYQVKEISQKWNKSESWVSRRIKLLRDLDNSLKHALKSGYIFPRVAQELSRLPQGKEQKRVLALVQKHRLTKDETGHLVDRWLRASPEEQLKIEDEFTNLCLPKKDIVSSEKEELQYAMKKCRQSLSYLLHQMNQSQNLEEDWPRKEYVCFLDLVRNLEGCLNSQGIGERVSR